MAGWQQRSCRELGNKYRVCISEAWNAMWQIPSWTTQWYTKYCNLVKHLFIFIFIPADLNCNIIIANSNKNNLTYKTKLTVSYDTRIHCDSYNAFYAWLPNIFPVYYVWKWHQTIAVYTMQAVYTNASCENRTPCVFPSLVWPQLIFPEVVSQVTRYTMLT